MASLPPDPPRRRASPNLVLVAPTKKTRNRKPKDLAANDELLQTRPHHNGGPPPIPHQKTPAEAQAKARQLFFERLDWLASVVDGAYIETESIRLDRDGNEMVALDIEGRPMRDQSSVYRRVRYRPELKQRLEAMEMLARNGRMAQAVATGADGEDHDESDLELAQKMIGLLNARPA